MFALTDAEIEIEQWRTRLTNSSAGALVTFEGWVRNRNDGRQVLRLQYESFESLAVKEGLRIIDEAKQKFDVLDSVCVHRTGDLAIGECAVWVGVTAEHRAAAFEACQYIINNVKARVPIWKKEWYTDGSTEWINCAQCHSVGQDRGSGGGEHAIMPGGGRIEDRGLEERKARR